MSNTYHAYHLKMNKRSTLKYSQWGVKIFDTELINFH